MTRKSFPVGHRGWPARYPDNSLAGFMAVSAEVEAVELDVRRSADGKLVLSHDPALGGLVVASTSWPTLSELDIGDGHHPALLDEVVVSLPDTPIDFEIKNNPWEPGYEPDHRIGLEVAERSRPGDIVSSFNWATADAVHQVFPDVDTGIIVLGPERYDPAFQHCFDVGHTVLVPSHHAVLSGQDLWGLEGLSIWAWTVNDATTARELVDRGVSGIITDDPVALAPVWSE